VVDRFDGLSGYGLARKINERSQSRLVFELTKLVHPKARGAMDIVAIRTLTCWGDA
jgi:hypothetical protein